MNSASRREQRGGVRVGEIRVSKREPGGEFRGEPCSVANASGYGAGCGECGAEVGSVLSCVRASCVRARLLRSGRQRLSKQWDRIASRIRRCGGPLFKLYSHNLLRLFSRPLFGLQPNGAATALPVALSVLGSCGALGEVGDDRVHAGEKSPNNGVIDRTSKENVREAFGIDVILLAEGEQRDAIVKSAVAAAGFSNLDSEEVRGWLMAFRMDGGSPVHSLEFFDGREPTNSRVSISAIGDAGSSYCFAVMVSSRAARWCVLKWSDGMEPGALASGPMDREGMPSQVASSF